MGIMGSCLGISRLLRMELALQFQSYLCQTVRRVVHRLVALLEHPGNVKKHSWGTFQVSIALGDIRGGQYLGSRLLWFSCIEMNLRTVLGTRFERPRDSDSRASLGICSLLALGIGMLNSTCFAAIMAGLRICSM